MGARWEAKERRQQVKSAAENPAHGKSRGLVAEGTGGRLFKMEDPSANFTMLLGKTEPRETDNAGEKVC